MLCVKSCQHQHRVLSEQEYHRRKVFLCEILLLASWVYTILNAQICNQPPVLLEKPGCELTVLHLYCIAIVFHGNA